MGWSSQSSKQGKELSSDEIGYATKIGGFYRCLQHDYSGTGAKLRVRGVL